MDQAPRRLTGLHAALELFRPLLAGCTRERLIVAHLLEDDVVAQVQPFAGGATDRIALPIRDIVTVALSAGSKAIVLAHNHPSGDTAPTPADLDGTRALALALKPLGIRVRDHLIFAGTGWESFRARGLL